MTPGFLSLLRSEEGSETRQPFLAAAQQIMSGKRIRKLLETLGGRAFDKGIAALL
jgi:hypothetical protein